MSYTPIVSSQVVIDEIISSGAQTVVDGGVVSSAIVSRGGEQYISSGGVVSDTTVSNGGRQYISEGGVASNITINYGGYQYISEGGIAFDTSVNSHAYQCISSGGVVSGLTISDGGKLFTNTDATIYDGTNARTDGHSAFSIVSGIASNLYIQDGHLTVFSGDSAINTLVSSGNITISSGGIAKDTNINSRGYQRIYEGGIALDTTINYSGHQYINDEGTALGVTVNNGGTQRVFSGGTASDIIINSSGFQTVDGGGIVSNVTINNGGRQSFYKDATAYNVTLHSGAIQHINSNAVISGLTVSDGAVLYTRTNANIYNGVNARTDGHSNFSIISGMASNFYLQNGQFFVLSGHRADNTLVESGAEQFISSGGVASGLLIHDGGQLYTNTGATVYDGINERTDGHSKFSIISGIASNLYVQMGRLTVLSGDSAVDTLVKHGSMFVSSGGTAIETTIDGGRHEISYGGIASDTVISNGQQNVYSGGTAVDTVICSGASQYVSAGGVASGLSISDGGQLYVENTGVTIYDGVNTRTDGHSSFSIISGVASNFYLQSAELNVLSGHSAVNTLIGNLGRQYIVSGATAINTTVNSAGYQYVSSGATVSGLTLSAGGHLITNTGATIYDGIGVGENGSSAFSIISGVASNLSCTGILNILAGDSAVNTFMDYGDMTVSSAAVALNTTIERGGGQHIYSGGIASNTILDGSIQQEIGKGGVANNTTLAHGATQQVSSDAIASTTNINSRGYQHILSGGSAIETTVNSSGYQVISANGVAINTVVNSGGSQHISAGGIASGITISSGGELTTNTDAIIYAGINARTDTCSNFSIISGVASNFHAYGGTFTVLSGHSATNTMIEDGRMIMGAAATAVDTIIISDGIQNLSLTARAVNTCINDNGTQYFHDGGTASATTINSGGKQFVNEGSTVFNTVINIGGSQSISSDGVASDTIINSGGSQYISRAGLALGTTVNIEGVQYVWSGVASGTTLCGGSQAIGHGGIASHAFISSGGLQTVSSRGYSLETTILSGGRQSLLKDSLTEGSVVNSGAIISANTSATVISSFNARTDGYKDFSIVNGMASNLLLENSGELTVYEKHETHNTLVRSAGTLNISRGATAFNTQVTENGTLYVSGGATAQGVVIESGGILVTDTYAVITNGINAREDGASNFSVISRVASNILLENGGNLTVNWIGHSACNTLVRSGGILNVSRPGTALNTHVTESGALYISSGGSALDLNVEDGGVLVANTGATIRDGFNARTDEHTSFSIINGVASNLLLESGGMLTVYQGDEAHDILVSSGGTIAVSSGGYISDLQIDGGRAQGSISVDNTSLNLANGADVSAANITVINSTISISGVDNTLGTISFDDDSTLVFDLSSMNEFNATVMVDNLSLSSSPSFTIILGDSDLGDGAYLLVSDISSFNETISLYSQSTFLANISLGESYTDTSTNTIYTLAIEDNVLQLASRYTEPEDTVSPTITSVSWDNPVTLTVEFSEAMDFTSLGSSVAIIDSNNNEMTASSVAKKEGTDSIYVFTFAEQSATGEYTISIGTGCTDTSDNALGSVYTENVTITPTDKTPPAVLTTVWTNPDTLTVTFSEAVDSSTLKDAVTLKAPDDTVYEALSFVLKEGTTSSYVFTFAEQTIEGDYTITIDSQCADIAGNSLTDTHSAIVNIVPDDTTAPTVLDAVWSNPDTLTLTFSEAMNVDTLKNSVTLQVSNNDIAALSVVLAEGTEATYVFTFEEQNAVGDYDITVGTLCVDEAGNALQTAHTETVHIIPSDITPPTIDSISWTNPDSLTVTFSEAMDVETLESGVTLTDNSSLMIKAESVTLEEGTESTYIFTFAEQDVTGDYSIILDTQCTDSIGNALQKPHTETVYIFSTDVTPPTVTNTSWYNQNTLEVTFSEIMVIDSLQGAVQLTNPDGFTYTASSVALKEGTSTSYVFTFADQNTVGSYTFSIGTQSADRTGNTLEAVYTETITHTEGDLVLQSVSTATKANTVESISVTWTVTAEEALSGQWTDGVYLSHDEVWDSSDVLLGSLLHENGLESGKTYTGELDVKLPALEDGTYYIIARTDIHHNKERLNVGDRTNNSVAEAITITIPELVWNEATESYTTQHGAVTTSGDTAYYKFAQKSGQSVEIQLDSDVEMAQMEIFVGYGFVPTDKQYSAKLQNGQEDGSLILPASISNQTVYVLVKARTAYKDFSYTLDVCKPALSVSDITPSLQSSATSSVFELQGSHFSEGMEITFVATNGTRYTPNSMDYINENVVRLTFDADFLPPDTYDLEVSALGQNTVWKDDVINMTANKGANFEGELVVPDIIVGDLTLSFALKYLNTGYESLYAPLVLVQMVYLESRKPRLTFSAADVHSGIRTIDMPYGFSDVLSFLASGDDVGILQPTGEGSHKYNVQKIYSAGVNNGFSLSKHVDYTAKCIQTSDTTPLDWGDILKSIDMDKEYLDALKKSLSLSIGDTYGDFVKNLNENAVYLDNFGVPTISSAEDLFTFEIAQAEGLPVVPRLDSATDISLNTEGLTLNFSRIFENTLSSRYIEGSLGYGWTTNWNIRLDIEGEGNTLILTVPNQIDNVYQKNYYDSFLNMSGGASSIKKNSDGYTATMESGLQYHFSPEGQLTYINNTNGNAITTRYDESGNLVALTHSDGQSLNFQYENGFLSSVCDQNGNVASYTYKDDHLNTVTSVTGNVTEYNFTAEEHTLNSITNSEGLTQYYTYNERGLLESMYLDGGIGATGIRYGTAGDVYVTDAYGLETEYYFGHLGQLLKYVDANNNAVYFSYDDDGNMISTTDQVGNKSTFSYDGNGNMTRSIDALGNINTYTYADYNNLDQYYDANGNLTDYDYDDLGNLTSITYADSSQEQWTYDSLGYVDEWTNRRGQTVDYDFDSTGKMTKRSYDDGTSVTFSYTCFGALSKIMEMDGDAESKVTTYGYDDKERIISIEISDGKKLFYTYDDANRRTSMTDELGNATNYHYNDLGQLSSIIEVDDSLIASYVYDNGGRLIETTHGNGTSTKQTYDNTGQILEINNYDAEGTRTSFNHYTYDALGLRTTMTTQDGTWTYGYDAIGQLIAANFAPVDGSVLSAESLRYEYDSMGNMLTKTHNGVVTNYTSNELNQTTSVDGTAYVYDQDGNLVEDDTKTYTWNSDNKCTSVTEKSTGEKWEYAYDAAGNRVSVTHNGVVTSYSIDPTGYGNVVNEYTDGAWETNYWHGLGLTGFTNATDSFYTNIDALSSVTGLIDINGNLVNSYSYLPFGGLQSSSGTVDSPFQFVGGLGIMSDDSGLQYMRARYYDSETGTFINSDPIGINGGMNTYAYAESNPVSFVDPSGCITLNQKASFDKIELILDNSHEPTILDHIENSWELGKKIGVPEVGIYFDIIRATYKQHVVKRKEYINAVNNYLNQTTSGILDSGRSLPHEGSWDPNDMLGPVGYTPEGSTKNENYVATWETLAYTVRFENDPELAKAPARYIRIENKLDEDFDIETFALSDFSIAGNFIEVEDGADSFNKILTLDIPGDVYDEKTGKVTGQELFEIRVDVRINVDTTTRTLVAEFTAVDNSDDPWIIQDPFKGLLFPNDDKGRGLGSLSYTIEAKADSITGTELTNVAKIIFDDNAPMYTDYEYSAEGETYKGPLLNTVDADAPDATISSVALSATQPEAGTKDPNSGLPLQYIDVAWSGLDEGAGVLAYDVYVSIDGGEKLLWKRATDATSATFEYACEGSQYAFYVRGIDYVGNYGEISEGLSFSAENIDANQTIAWNSLSLVLDDHGNATLGWGMPSDTGNLVGYDVKYGRNAVEVAYMSVGKDTTSVDLSSLGDGGYEWWVRSTYKNEDGTLSHGIWVKNSATDIGNTGNSDEIARLVEGTDSGTIFTYQQNSLWANDDYVAQNAGSLNHQGTEEIIAIKGYQRNYNHYKGGDGYDILTLTGNKSAFFLEDDNSLGSIAGGRLSGIEEIRGGSGETLIDLTSTKWATDDIVLRAGTGNSLLWSSSGDDILLGQAGDDKLYGGAGNDILYGGAGNDQIDGGGDNDTIVYDSNDWGQDTIRQSASGTLKLLFTEGITTTDITQARDGDDLRISRAGSDDTILVEDYYASTATTKILYDNGDFSSAFGAVVSSTSIGEAAEDALDTLRNKRGILA